MYTTTRNLIFSLLLISFASFAQTKSSVKWGATISDEKETKFHIIGADDDAVYVLRFQKARGDMSVPFFVSLNRNTMQVMKSVEMQIPIPEDGTARMGDVYFLKDRFVLMITLGERKNKKNAVLAYLMDKTGAISSDYKMILETDADRRDAYPHLFFQISPDSTHFLAGSLEPYHDHQITAAVIDKDLHPTWTTSFSLEAQFTKRNNISLIESALDVNYNMLMMVKATGKAIVDNEPTNTLLVFSSAEKKLKLYTATPPEKTVNYMMGRFVSDKEGHSVFAGLYGEKSNDAIGVAIASYKDGSFHSSNLPFSDNFRKAFMSDSKAAKGGTVDNIAIDDVIPNPDGAFEVLIHRYYPRAFVAASAIKIGADLKEAWSAPLPIYFWEINDYLNYNTMLTSKELCFIYNDHAKNKDIIDPREVTGLAGLSVSHCVVTHVDLQSGKVSKETIPGTDETYLIPRKCYQSADNEMLLFAKRKENVNFGKLILR